MDKGSPHELSRYRLSQAKNCLDVAKVNIDSGFYKDAINRLYYSVFHSMRAVLALCSFDSKKHKGVISEFQKQYIKTGIFLKDFTDIIKKSFQIKNNSDYEDFYIVIKDDALKQLKGTQVFFEAVSKYIDELGGN